MVIPKSATKPKSDISPLAGAVLLILGFIACQGLRGFRAQTDSNQTFFNKPFSTVSFSYE